MIYPMENVVQKYAWGSRDALSRLYGFANAANDPLAELWMGAHPAAPSRIIIDGTPQSMPAVPFLFKILCAAEPLSIQAHPSREIAAAGFDDEERAGKPLDAPDRNYRDRNHKPELICAITPFWGLRGFRPVDDIREEFSDPGFAEAPRLLRVPSDDDGLREFLTSLLTLADDDRRDVVAAALAVAASRWRRGTGSLPDRGDPLARYYWVLRIAEVHPGDPGILAPLFLHVFALEPGEATYQPAGVLHAYLDGVGAELMACSDNVLRGGMTVKHIDVAELSRVVVFASETPPVVVGQPVVASFHNAGAFVRYPAPFDEFELWRGTIGGSAALPSGGPQIVFCHEGTVTVESPGVSVDLVAGASAFIDATDDAVGMRGTGVVFVARVP